MSAPPASDLATRLAQCRADWLPRYFPAGHLEGGMFLLGDADGSPGRSLPIPLRTTKGKIIVDFAGGFVGDDLDLLGRAIGADSKAAYKEALAFLGIAGKVRPRRPPPPAALRPAPPKSGNRELAQEIWRQTESIQDGGLAFDYLTKRRGITAWNDDRVRWHPRTEWGGIIVCPVVSATTGYTTAIWCIRPSMTGKVARWGYGPCKGNFAPVWWPEGDELAIAEGIEDSLAVYQREGLPCVAALSATGMDNLNLSGVPSWIRRVTIFADRDPNLVGQRAAHALADRLRAEGRHARVLEALNHKDPNDLLLGGSQ